MSEPSRKQETVTLVPKDFDSAAILLAEAFYDNPSNQYIFADPATRLNFLQWGLKANLKLNLASSQALSHSFALVKTDKQSPVRQVQAMGFWHPPEFSHVSLIAKIKSGFLLAPIKFGKATYERLSEVINAMEEIKTEILGQNQAWYLNNLAVAKELRGIGIGTKLVAEQLQTKVIPSQFPAILMTQQEKNVSFYRQLGFKAVSCSVIGNGENAFTNWCMLFDAGIE